MSHAPPAKGWPPGAILVLLGGCLVAWFAFRSGAPRPALEAALPAAHDPPAAVAASAPGQLKVTYWNLEWFPGHVPNASSARRAAHVAAVVPVLQRLDPDLLGLEEIADADAARLLTDHLAGFKVDVCSAFRLGNGEVGRQQTVLCSRLPLIQGWSEAWKPAADGLIPRRGFVFAAYRLPDNAILLAYGVHLKSNRVDDPGGAQVNIPMREEAGRQLLAHEQAMQAAYAKMGRIALVLVGGDMNTSLDDPRFAAETTLRALRSAGGFAWGWQDVPLGLRLTLPAEGRYPDTCFDHIFYRGAGMHFAGCALEATGRDCSDHRPLTAVFTP